MKNVLLAMLFMLPVLASETPYIERRQQLNVIIAGKHYELQGITSYDKVLPVGDYMARISQDKTDANKEYVRVYELLFADGSTRKYTVVGESE